MSGSVRQISTDRVFLKRFLKYHSILKSLLHYFLDESCTFIWQIVVVDTTAAGLIHLQRYIGVYAHIHIEVHNFSCYK